MKKGIITLLFAAVFMTSCNSNSNTQTKTVNNERTVAGEGPIISFVKTKAELDTITTTEGTQCTFYYTNTGDQPLLLSSAISSCGCVKIDWSKDPLMPGLSDSITISVKTQQLGNLMKAVVIKSNATNEPIVTLRMFGFVIDKKQNTIAQNIPNHEKNH